MPVDLTVGTVESANEPRPSTRDLGLPETADLNTKVGSPLVTQSSSSCADLVERRRRTASLTVAGGEVT